MWGSLWVCTVYKHVPLRQCFYRGCVLGLSWHVVRTVPGACSKTDVSCLTLCLPQTVTLMTMDPQFSEGNFFSTVGLFSTFFFSNWKISIVKSQWFKIYKSFAESSLYVLAAKRIVDLSCIASHTKITSQMLLWAFPDLTYLHTHTHTQMKAKSNEGNNINHEIFSFFQENFDRKASSVFQLKFLEFPIFTQVFLLYLKHLMIVFFPEHARPKNLSLSSHEKGHKCLISSLVFIYFIVCVSFKCCPVPEKMSFGFL